jgi:hypothetical protein
MYTLEQIVTQLSIKIMVGSMFFMTQKVSRMNHCVQLFTKATEDNFQ